MFMLKVFQWLRRGKKSDSKNISEDESVRKTGASGSQLKSEFKTPRSLPSKERIQDLIDDGDIQVARKLILDELIIDPFNLEAAHLLAELSDGIHRHIILMECLRINPRNEALFIGILATEIEYFRTGETPSIGVFTARLGRFIEVFLEANNYAIPKGLLVVLEDVHNNNPMLAREVSLAIFGVLSKKSRKIAMSYFSLIKDKEIFVQTSKERVDLVDDRIGRAAFYASKREKMVLDSLELLGTFDSEDDRDFEKWKLLDYLEKILMGGTVGEVEALIGQIGSIEKSDLGSIEFLRAIGKLKEFSVAICEFLERNKETEVAKATLQEVLVKFRNFVIEESGSTLFDKEVVRFGAFDDDVRHIPLHALGQRVAMELGEVGADEVLKKLMLLNSEGNMRESRRLQIVLATSKELKQENPEAALELMGGDLNEKNPDERIVRIAAQCHGRMGDYPAAIELLQNRVQPSSLNLLEQMKKWKNWIQDGYDLDFLGDMSEYHSPKIGVVLYNVHSSLPYVTSGYTIRTRGIVGSMKDAGLEVIVNSRWGFPKDRRDYDGEGEIPPSLIQEGVEYRFSPDSEGMIKHKMEDFVRMAASSILSKALEHRPSVIHAASDHTIGLAAAMVAKALSVPFVYEIRGLWAHSRAANNPGFLTNPKFTLMMRLEKQCALSADRVFVISKAIRDEVKTWGVAPGNIFLLPNGVNNDHTAELVEAVGKGREVKEEEGGKQLILGYIGSIVPYEGLETLVRAIGLLPKKIRGMVQCRIAGAGSSLDGVIALVEELGLATNFHFLGKIPQGRVGEFYHGVDAIVLPRTGDSVCELVPPLKPIEAMAFSKPLLMSDVAPAVELVEESGCGLLFNKSDPKSLSELIKDIIQNPMIVEGMGERGERWVADRRDWGKLVKPLMEQYTILNLLSSSEGIYAEVEKTREIMDCFAPALGMKKGDLLATTLENWNPENQRAGRNLFTAGIRVLGLVENNEALSLFKQFDRLYGDSRSLRTAVTLNNRARRYEKSLELLSRVEEGDWKNKMLAELENRSGFKDAVASTMDGERSSKLIAFLEGAGVDLEITEKLKELEFEQLGNLRVACVMDDFSHSCFKNTCQLYQLSHENWEDEMGDYMPDILIVESAWNGKDGSWSEIISHRGFELIKLLYWCKIRGIGTVFWNKEDPVHFNTFLNSARLFDYVFTTDVDCIPRYINSLGHSRVGFLPFASQPSIHNPIEEFQRDPGICFAGAHYERYSRRSKDMQSIIPHFDSKEMPVVIFDRNYGTTDERYRFPDKYNEYIRGTLPYQEIGKAYKGFNYAMNFNSIKDSQTMMARRIFELMASNTLIVSNYSRSCKVIFGDLMITSDSGLESKKIFDNWLSIDSEGRRRRLLALRKVMTEHTYSDRLARIIGTISEKELQWTRPSITVISRCSTEKEMDNLRTSVERQLSTPSKILLISNVDSESLMWGDCEVEIVSQKVAMEEYIGNKIDQSGLLCFMSPLDYYGPNYLTDIGLSTRYSDANAITKSCYWGKNKQGNAELFNEGSRYKHTKIWNSGSLSLKIECLDKAETIGSLSSRVADKSIVLDSCISIDEFNYFENWYEVNGIGNEPEDVNDLMGVNQGIDLVVIDEIAHGKPEEFEVGRGKKSLELVEIFRDLRSEEIQISQDHEALFIDSTLSDGAHYYHYSNVQFSPNELGFVNGVGEFHLDAEPGLTLSLAFIFFNGEGERIGSEIIGGSLNKSVSLEEGTETILLGIRIYSSGKSLIRSILLEFKDLTPRNFIGGNNSHLVLANNYPEYDDLYRNAFIHSRIKRYNSHNVGVDVFRLKPGSSLKFHEFEGQEVMTGSEVALDYLLSSNNYDSVLVHFLDENMWKVLTNYIDDIDVFVWLHGSEIQPWHRRKFNYESQEELNKAKESSQKKEEFWSSILRDHHPRMHLIFVSEYFSEEVMDDYGIMIRDNGFSVIHNPIDTDRFTYRKKSPKDRFRILSIRTFASAKYANDISVNAIIELSERKDFERLDFLIIGDGALFEEVTTPLADMDNVTLNRGFLSNDEYERIFDEYGIFLTPTRWDSQGVGRDEAMACGVVPATNRISAIPEFADDSCAILADPEDFKGLAAGIGELIDDSKLFMKKSLEAAKRVRLQTSHEITIPKEIELFTNPIMDDYY